VLVPYFLVGAYLFKIARAQRKPVALAVAVGASAYGLWLLYASGPLHLLLSVVLYAPGMLLFMWARRNGRGEGYLNKLEKIAMGVLIAGSAPAMWLLLR